MTWFDWLIVALLNGSVIGYGLYLARGTHTSSEWFLGSRALPWWAVGLSMFATNVDNADIVSVTGKTYSEGVHILTVYAVGSALGGVLAAFCITPAIYRLGFYTNAEYLEARFGPATRLLSALVQLQYRSSMLGIMTWSVYLLLTGLDIVGPVSAWIMIVAMVVFSGLYTAWGGLKSVVWTDACQSLVMMVGGAVIFYAVWHAVGGFSGMRQALAAAGVVDGTRLADLPHIGRFSGNGSPYIFTRNGASVDWGPYIVALGWTIIGCGYWTVNHTQTMRLMGTRSLWDMKMAAVFGVSVSLPIMIACAFLGVFGRAIPEFQQLDAADQIYPLLAKRYLGVGLKGLVVAGLVAASVSTFDSMGSALSAVFTRDIYARFIVRDRDDSHYVFVGRAATVAVLFTGFLYIPFIVLQKHMLDAFTTLIPVFVTPLFTIYLGGVLTRANRRSGLWAMVAGSTYGIFALYCREAPKTGFSPAAPLAPVWFTDQWAALVWSLLITALAMLAATMILGRDPPKGLKYRAESGWLQRSRDALPPLREHPFSGPLAWWLQPAIYAALMLLVMSALVFIVFW